MEVICNPTAPICEEGTAVAFGAFDGLHKGHMALINQLLRLNHYKKIVFTFRDNPSKMVYNINIKYIISQEYKESLLAGFGIDILAIQDFTADFMNMEAEVFFDKYILGILKAKVVIVGYNFAFGKGNKGDVSLLQDFCNKNGVTLYVIPPVKEKNTIVSSTAIRALISKGDLGEANKMLGRPFTIYQKVIKGKQLGRTIGFPTANMMLEEGQALPPQGVYITDAVIEDQIYPGVSNLGGRPTIEAGYHALETYIMNYQGDLYGRSIAIRFYEKLRDITRFDSVEGLKAQILADSQKTEQYFEKKLFTI